MNVEIVCMAIETFFFSRPSVCGYGDMDGHRFLFATNGQNLARYEHKNMQNQNTSRTTHTHKSARGGWTEVVESEGARERGREREVKMMRKIVVQQRSMRSVR